MKTEAQKRVIDLGDVIRRRVRAKTGDVNKAAWFACARARATVVYIDRGIASVSRRIELIANGGRIS